MKVEYSIKMFDIWGEEIETIRGSREYIKSLWKSLRMKQKHWHIHPDSAVAHLYCTMHHGGEVFLDSMNTSWKYNYKGELVEDEIWLGRMEGVMC